LQSLLRAVAPQVAAAGPSAVRPSPSPRQMRRGETLVIDQPQGQAVICTEGALWITHDCEPADHVLEGGGRYSATCSTRMLVHAMSDAKIEVFAA
jgi:hypothetical protein